MSLRYVHCGLGAHALQQSPPSGFGDASLGYVFLGGHPFYLPSRQVSLYLSHLSLSSISLYLSVNGRAALGILKYGSYVLDGGEFEDCLTWLTHLGRQNLVELELFDCIKSISFSRSQCQELLSKYNLEI